jgi:hypothetical protein
VVCRNGEVVCESINSVREDDDVTHHAEVAALRRPLVAFDEQARRLHDLREHRTLRVGGPLPADLLKELSVRREVGLQDRLMSFLRRQVFDRLPRK